MRTATEVEMPLSLGLAGILQRITRSTGVPCRAAGGLPILAPHSVEEARRAVAAAAAEGLAWELTLDRQALSQVGLVDRRAMWIGCGAGAQVAQVEAALLREGLTLGSQPEEILAGDVASWLEGPLAGRRSMDGRLESGVAAVQGVLRDGTPLDGRPAPRSALGPQVGHLLLGGGGRCGWVLGAVLKAQRQPLREEWIALEGGAEALLAVLHQALHLLPTPIEARFVGRQQLLLRCGAGRQDERLVIHRLCRQARAAGLQARPSLPPVEPVQGRAIELPWDRLALLVGNLAPAEGLQLVRLARESCVATTAREIEPLAGHGALLERIAAALRQG